MNPSDVSWVFSQVREDGPTAVSNGTRNLQEVEKTDEDTARRYEREV